jgi:UDP-3-O-[3-hydroxymyristoyl] glucosamine N-acyltransferase
MPKTDKVVLTLGKLAKELQLEYRGDAEHELRGVASLASATNFDLCFFQSSSYLERLKTTECGAIIVPLDFTHDIVCRSLLYAINPHLAFVKAIHLFHPQANNVSNIHVSAQVSEAAKLGANVSVGANSVIAENVKIGEGVSIGAGCIIEQGSRIGTNTRLHAGVTICHDVVIGAEVIIHPGVVIGSDGFGLVYDGENWVKIPHLGRVCIGDRVEIGANTTIDRGALDDTVIGNGVKLDNLIQVAHNVEIGDNTAIAACVGIAGSAVIGKNCKISGAAVILGHLSITDNVTITAMSLVSKSIKKSGTYSSGTPLMENRLWHRNNARYKTLDNLARIVSRLEKK